MTVSDSWRTTYNYNNNNIIRLGKTYDRHIIIIISYFVISLILQHDISAATAVYD